MNNPVTHSSDSSAQHFISPQELKWLLICYNEGTLEPSRPKRPEAPRGKIIGRSAAAQQQVRLHSHGMTVRELLEQLKDSSEKDPAACSEEGPPKPESLLVESDPRARNLLVQELLSRLEEFRFVFETNDKSIFFGLESGSTMRLRFAPNGNIDTRNGDTSLWREIVFVDKFQYNKMKTTIDNAQSSSALVGEDLEIQSVRPELFPVCFGKEGHSRVRFERLHANVVRLLGDAEGELSGGLMHGTYVTRVFKGSNHQVTAQVPN
jgi:hypothetical protein